MKAKKDGIILHYWMLPSDQWMQSYELFRETFLPSIPLLHFHFQFALSRFFALSESKRKNEQWKLGKEVRFVEGREGNSAKNTNVAS